MLVKKNKTRVNRIVVISVFAILTAIFCFSFLLNTAPALAQGSDLLYGGQEGNISNTIGLGSEDPRIIIARVIRAALGFLGIIALFIIMYSGWMWMTSEGSPDKVDLAKKILKNGFIGLVIILTSFGITSFLINKLYNATGGGLDTTITTPPVITGFGAIGSCTVESTYPAPWQKDVPRNIKTIMVTFKEEVNINTLCADNTVPPDGDCVDQIGGNNVIADNIVLENVRIYQTTQGDSCIWNPPIPSPPTAGFWSNCGVTNLVDVKVSTTDNKTFVFIPDNLLGSPSQYIYYTIHMTNDIEKLTWTTSLDRYIFETCSPQYLEWSFEVSNRIDLDPPQVINYGVFPPPDNNQDSFMVTSLSEQAIGSTTLVNIQPIVYSPATVALPGTVNNPPIAIGDINIDPTNSYTGRLNVLVLADGITAQLEEVPSTNLFGTAVFSGNTVSFPGFFDLTEPSGTYAAGSSWDVDLTAEVFADTLTVGSVQYVFGTDIPLGGILAQTATNTAAALMSNPLVYPDYTPGSNSVDIIARIAGAAGNSIAIYTSSSTNIAIVPMHNGVNVNSTTLIYGQKDQPRNSVIQIDFNEAINPLTLSGDAQALQSYIRVKCTNGCTLPDPGLFMCNGDICVDGKFEVSNQYTTVGFISNDLCGINGCGEKIYCLPEDSEIQVELNAASLDNTCVADSDCDDKYPYGTCNVATNICQNNTPPIRNHPISRIPFDGVMDTALNSLDGDRSSDATGADAEGPVSQTPASSAYFENDIIATCVGTTNPGRICTDTNAIALCGATADCQYALVAPLTVVDLVTRVSWLQGLKVDDYQWMFYVSNVLDLTEPLITDIIPTHNPVTPPGLLDPVEVEFNKAPTLPYIEKLMMSSSLRTGQIVIQSGTNIYTHKYINLKSLSGSQVGYWITKNDFDNSTPNDGFVDYTKAYINHSDYREGTAYRSQVGSGVKDIYQNCFKPSSSTACVGSPSCCGLAGQPACPPW